MRPNWPKPPTGGLRQQKKIDTGLDSYCLVPYLCPEVQPQTQYTMNNPINTPAAQLVKGGLVKSGNFYGEVADISGDIVTIESGNDETLTAKIDDCETISPNEYLNYLFTPRK